MASEKMTYNGTATITHNGREVELKLYATAWWYHSKETRLEPEVDETEIDEIEISDAHYSDTNEPVPADEIYEDVYSDLYEHLDYYFTLEDRVEDDSGMDCVDRWNVKNGIEV